MALDIPRSAVDKMSQQATASYPHECQGFLLGIERDGRMLVADVVPVPNVWASYEDNPYEVRPQDSERNRTLVDPKDFLRIDREARSKGLDMICYYHSHPDHPARPSEFDRIHAHPFFIYVILSVEKSVPRELTVWVLSEDMSQFLPVELKVLEE